MTDRWMDRLSEYLDGTLAPAERQGLVAHLAECAACTATLAELRRVVARAGALDDRPPAADLWPRIAARLGGRGALLPFARRSARRVSFTVPQLAAAGIALVALSLGGGWLAQARRAPAGSASTSGASVDHNAVWVRGADSEYDAAVSQLRAALNDNRSLLDSTTVSVLEKNLAIIDSAVSEARHALAQDPNNQYLNHHLAETMRRKVEFLRRASSLAGART
ncbi:MAG TPA: anti-sigma factor [Gemmatimonadales bacterium]